MFRAEPWNIVKSSFVYCAEIYVTCSIRTWVPYICLLGQEVQKTWENKLECVKGCLSPLPQIEGPLDKKGKVWGRLVMANASIPNPLSCSALNGCNNEVVLRTKTCEVSDRVWVELWQELLMRCRVTESVLCFKICVAKIVFGLVWKALSGKSQVAFLLHQRSGDLKTTQRFGEHNEDASRHEKGMANCVKGRVHCAFAFFSLVSSLK